MKYSQLIGILSAAALIGSCFLPWTELPLQQIVYNGLYAKANDYLTTGHQWMPHSFLALVAIVFFAVKNKTAKQANILVAFINLAWAIKNFILFSLCRPGQQIECPQLRIGLVLVVLLSVIIQVMSFLPQGGIGLEDE